MPYNKVAIVIIGRNEGDRLKRCLKSINELSATSVYVDSGSTDNSIEHAKSFGIASIQLNSHLPFSAGRARNEGFKFLLQSNQIFEYVQFLDGDCELNPSWIDNAISIIEQDQRLAIISGKLKEKYPEKSIYNRLCDIEWDTPIGEVTSCGGIFLIKRHAFQDIKGFNTSIIAGEEPELCYRLRQKGWKILKIDHKMALHDSAIYKFSQWWKRATRSGHAYAQGFLLHGNENEKFNFKDTLRIWCWAIIFPSIVLYFSFTVTPYSLLLFIIYLIQIIRVSFNINKRLKNWNNSFLYAFFNWLAKWPQSYGQLLFFFKHLIKNQHQIIEYK